MAKEAVLVFGPESSGNRLLMECLVRSGCDGDYGHVQRWDKVNPTADRIAWGKSIPSDSQWPDIAWMVTRLRTLGYRVRVLVLTRNWHALSRSQLRHDHARSMRQALTQIQSAYRHIFMQLATVAADFLVCHFDALVHDTAVEWRTVTRFLEWPDAPCPVRVENMNRQYVEAVPLTEG